MYVYIFIYTDIFLPTSHQSAWYSLNYMGNQVTILKSPELFFVQLDNVDDICLMMPLCGGMI